MSPLIPLLLVSLVSEAVSQICTGQTFYFYYNREGKQVIEYRDLCTSADEIRECQEVKEIVKKYHPTLGVRPFDEFAKTYVNCFVEKIMRKRKPTWVDLYGKKEELQSSKYQGHHLRALMTDIEYETPKTLNTKVDSLLDKTLTNSQQSEEISGEISQEITKAVESVKSRQHDWNVGASVEVGASDIFKIASVSVETSAEYSGSSAEDITNSTSRTYTISDTVKVPAGTTARVMWTMTEANVKIGWTSKMQISGMMAAEVDRVIYFFPVGHMAVVYDEYFKRVSSHAISLEGKGNFYTTTSLQSSAYVTQYPVGNSPACFS